MNNCIFEHELSIPWPFHTIAEAAKLRADKTPSDIAIYTQEHGSLNYGKIWRQSLACADYLNSLGLKPGDVISFQLPNWHEAAIINIAASILGVVINPIVPIYRGKELIYMLKEAKSKCIFIPESFRNYNYEELIVSSKAELSDLKNVIVLRPENKEDTFQNILNRDVGQLNYDYSPNINDKKLLLFTSGTTGKPKGVYHSHYSLFWAMQNCADFWSLNEHDLMFMPSPVTHITGYTFGLELPFSHRVPSALMVQWKADEAVQWINKIGATVCVGATPFLQELTDICKTNPDQQVSLRLFACGGAAVAPNIIYDANTYLGKCKAVRVYGSSETPIVTLGFTEPQDNKLAATTDGQVFRYIVKVVNDENELLPFNVEGEILVKGKSMMLGYMSEDDTTAAIDYEGYFETGDLGYLTQDKAIVITGRKKDLIIRGGENISAKEIEDVLILDPDIREVAVIAIPHQRLVETVGVYVVADKPIDLTYISALCAKAELAKQKYPQYIACVNELPKTASGKVQKHILREMIKEQKITI
ncbi:MAG: cyclohexanecarboxylate-CoA ligase [Alteromonadales bacterium]|nr:cyclohexanecarboxylate-CoA ligase [Alteromonadales bacterium]